ncbi:hypothetical protein [Paenibacillus polymyxa]|uniref:M1-733 n=1 Tax=Paenibacillus polymyxa (strain SC2) TaxID=886882 RepID=E3EF63_PAEPS|nr:hypothetical protein [Paenibacillus polymyxa]ADO54583.1 M1-733 [Paenibacillus polymyxa SC2]OAZ39260.1 hypothetical protein A9Z39_25480 [Paenibacillus polymyxa]WPQ57470.1 hypothetical protein SKN87_03140 [Paenibacillus polymyxa]CCC83496.1 hypothetical protein PPM_0559 [Paenibacillus polymyxa M1]
MEQNDINIHQLTDEIYQILHKRMDKLGIAYGIVTEFSYNPEEPTSWTISIENSKIVLTSAILFQYMKQHHNLEDTLTHFMRDHFSYFN